MCGIAGVLHLDGNPASRDLVDRMTQVMRHRGPDGKGTYVDGPVALGHRRLSIIDLSDSARQPMENEDGSVVFVYNGEIYNFPELRRELEEAGHTFRSRTDSEVLAHGYEEWSTDVVNRFNGMFAFGLWDRQQKRLVLGRDRFGVKPIYWYSRNGIFLFASEVRALLEHPMVERRVSPQALNEYFTFQNILTDLTLFEGIHLLPPGHLLVVDAHGHMSETQYWDYPFDADPIEASVPEIEEELERLFVQAVRRQLRSDVPIGAYLSGGIDSGSIASVASASLGRLRTFTGGFDLSSASGLELGFDERGAAEVMANLVKSEHYEVVLHAGDMEHVMPELIWHLEDLRVGQCYPNYYVARLAGKFVRVVLSGAGGDELFGGYPWRYYRGLGATDRSDYMWRYYGFWQRLVRDEEKEDLFAAEVRSQIAGQSTFDQFRAVFAGFEGKVDTPARAITASLYFELKTFLPGLLLVEDKVSMAHSLETRVPFLDNDLVDWAVRLPARYKLRDLDQAPKVDENAPGKNRLYELATDNGKVALRGAMAKIVPADVATRSKQGFSAPDASWFRGESIDYVQAMLSDRKARIYEFLQPRFVESKLAEHTSGRHNHRLLIWSLLSFEWWLRLFLESDTSAVSQEASVQAGRHSST